MPYKTTSEVGKGLPRHAQEIYRAAFNAAYEEHGEKRAHAIAWSAVKAKYAKNKEGKWVAKDGGPTFRSTSDLPGNVKALPGKAKELWLETYNAAIRKYTEREADRMAWAAVRAQYKQSGGSWLSRDSADYIVTHELEDNFDFTDAGSSMRVTGDGYLLAQPRVARIGIQEYRGTDFGLVDKDIVRVFRPETEVFKADAMSSLAHRPITLDHPVENVNSKNWRKHAIGTAGDEIVRDGEFVRIPMMIMDQAAIDAIRNGHAQLSVGYSADVRFESGITDSGDEYDAVQTGIRANHIAIVQKARGGPKLRLGDGTDGADPKLKEKRKMSDRTILVDGIKVELPETEATVVEKHIATLGQQIKDVQTTSAKAIEIKDAEISALRATITTKDASIVDLQKQIKDMEVKLAGNQMTPAQLDQMVKDRLVVVEQARKLIGDALKVDGVSNADIRKQVVLASSIGEKAAKWSDEAIIVAFDTLVATAPAASGNLHDVAASFARPVSFGTADAALEAEKAEYIKDLRDAWRKPGPQQ